jgi:hypothetical protein
MKCFILCNKKYFVIVSGVEVKFMNSNQREERTHLLKQIKIILIVFIAGLMVSGVTAFPLEAELSLADALLPEADHWFTNWIRKVYKGVRQTNASYPFVAYGTDWLAFAHLMIAVLFIGPLRNPIKNIWVVQFGLIACASIFPLAFIAGHIREIPFFWQLIDCSFGLFGGVLLYWCYLKILKLEKMKCRNSEIAKETRSAQSFF